MKTSDFDYSLPLELIAQTPIELRDQSRLMVLNRSDSSMEPWKFFEMTDYLRAGDVLLFNDSRVIPAHLNGRKIDSGGRVEILLLRRLDTCAWETLVKPGKRVNIGTMIEVINDSVVDNRHEAKVLPKVIGLRQEVASQLSQAKTEGQRIIEQVAQNSNDVFLEPFEIG